jgi:4-hydroxybenzoate polyprenyltransferase
LKSFYRKEPITGLIITAGAVNALLGGMNEIGSLFVLGLLASSGAIAYRWWMIKQTTVQQPEQLYLPPTDEYSEIP